MLLQEEGASETIDPEALLARSDHYARREGATAETLACLAAFCRDAVTRAILAMPEARLDSLLVNDAYKARMHRLYARLMPGVQTDFELSVRRTPVPLAQIRDEDPELWRRFLDACGARLSVLPYPPEAVQALDACFPHFSCSPEMLARAEHDGVAPLTWHELDGQPVAFSCGPVEASSHVETTLTQLVQEVTVAAQVRRLRRLHGIQLTPTELLGNSLAKLALCVESLAAEAQAQTQAARLLAADGRTPQPPPGLMLFAGRRSSSRRYLVLQNWYCMRHLPHYQGTSATMAVTLLRPLLQQQEQGLLDSRTHLPQQPQGKGLPDSRAHAPQQQQGHRHQLEQGGPAGCVRLGASQPAGGQPAGGQSAGGQRLAEEQPAEAQQQDEDVCEPQPERPLLRLVGTLAHEVMMICDQLLGCYDELDGTANGIAGDRGPAQICALLAHLLLLAAAGGVHAATALSDTFGTRGFVSAALAARIPEEFRRDVQQRYPDQWAALPQAAKASDARAFDLFSWWRMDSGSYEQMAGYVMDAWEARWGGRPAAARPPRPRLMHSNLGSVDKVVDAWRLPPRIRPAAFAFGTLADGFLPFDLPTNSDGSCGGSRGGSCGDGGGVEHVQIGLASVVMKAVQNRLAGSKAPCSTESAGKLGDDVDASKAQFDRRLPPDAVERTRQRMLLLSRERPALDSDAASAALAAAYHAVTRGGVLR